MAAVMESFVRDLQDPSLPVISADRFQKTFELQQQELATLAHVHRATIKARPTNQKLQAYMRDVMRVMSAALEINPERTAAIYWFRNHPIPEFGHLTAEALVSEGKTEAVLWYLQSIAHGSTG